MNSVLVTLSFLFFVLLYETCKCLNPQNSEIPFADGEGPGTPLFLTPLIESGKIDEARRKAAVKHQDISDEISSYSGYLTVNKQYNSNLFFWFFPAMIASNAAPVVLWLQGGPSMTSMFGLFVEHGPFFLTFINAHLLQERRYSWHLVHNIIYMDSPVGTGYSFTDNEEGYARNFTQVARDVHTALVQFFLMFPELQNNTFFVTGEAYAGKYVAAVAHEIKNHNIEADTKINLKGLAIGNGFCDPENQLLYSDYLYQIGLVDFDQKTEFQKYEEATLQLIKENKFVQAFENYYRIFYKTSTSGPSLFYNLTGFDHNWHYINSNVSNDNYYQELWLFNSWIQTVYARYAIHVGNNTFNIYNSTATDYQKEDYLKSVVVLLQDLLEHYKVLIYSGQLDIIYAHPFTENYLQKMKWSGAEKFANASRKVWKVRDDIAGFTKSADNLKLVFVRNAGQKVPRDKPKWALDLIYRFTRNMDF